MNKQEREAPTQIALKLMLYCNVELSLPLLTQSLLPICDMRKTDQYRIELNRLSDICIFFFFFKPGWDQYQILIGDQFVPVSQQFL